MNEAAALAQVLFIDIALSSDNAIVIGMAAAGLAERQRRQAIVFGIAAAIVLRVALSLMAVSLINVRWLSGLGGLLLLWVCWKLFADLRRPASEADEAVTASGTLGGAVLAIIVADASMSLDNVLAVAGASKEFPAIMAIGLIFSIALMAVAADYTARALERHRWLGYAGCGLIFYVAIRMISDDLTWISPRELETIGALLRPVITA